MGSGLMGGQVREAGRSLPQKRRYPPSNDEMENQKGEKK